MERPLFSFGVIADVQFAVKDDAEASEGNGRIKRYRDAATKLVKAVNYFNNKKDTLLLVLSLGDIIDGNITQEKTWEDFNIIHQELIRLELPWVHVIGNHCLALPRDSIMAKLGMSAPYYQQELCHDWALIVLDTMDMSVKWPSDSEKFKEAQEFMKSRPLSDEHPQMALWNGGLTSVQKAWLMKVLSDAERNGTKLIIAAHHPLVAGSAPESHLAWNHQEVASMLLESPAVVLFLCGHYHPGGYTCIKGKHFVTLQAILEAPPSSEAHGVVSVYRDKIIIQGHGSLVSRDLSI